MSVARDGTGGLVYLKSDGSGTPHVFVSRLLGAAPPRSLETVLDELADAVAPHLDINRLEEVVA